MWILPSRELDSLASVKTRSSYLTTHHLMGTEKTEMESSIGRD
jgi:hypothetical protein